MNQRNVIESVLLAFYCFGLFSCEQPPESFQRTGDRDPLNENFVPTKASELSFEITYGTLVLSWNDESDFEDGYVVEKAINDTLEFEQVAELPPNTQQFKDPDIGYFNISYRISPFVKRNGKINKADYKALFLNRFQPSIWFELSTEKKTKIHIIHEPPSDLSVEGYELERYESTSFVPYADRKYEVISHITDLSSAPHILYIDTTLVRDGHVYDFRMRAYNKDGKSFYYGSHCCYGTRDFQISPPTILVPEHDSRNSVFLTWKFNDNKADGVIIERREANQQAFNVIATLYTPETRYLDRNVDPDKTYVYRIKSFGSEYSQAANIVYYKGLSEAKRFASGGQTRWIAARPGTEEFATTYRPGTYSPELHKVKLWRASEDSPYEEVSFDAYIEDIEFHSSGQYMVLGFGNEYVRTYAPGDLSTFAYSRAKQDVNLTSVSVQPGSNTAAIGYEDGAILIMEFTSFAGDSATVQQVLHDLDSVTDVQFSADGNTLAASGRDGSLIVYEVSKNYQVRAQIQGHENVIRQLAISNDSKLIATCALENVIKLWNSNDLSQETAFSYREFRSPYHVPFSVKFSKSDDLLFVGTSQNTLLVWNIEQNKLHQVLYTREDDVVGSVSDLAVSQAGTHLYSTVYFETILWELKEQWIKEEN